MSGSFIERVKRGLSPVCYQTVFFLSRSNRGFPPSSEFRFEVRFQIRGLYSNTDPATAIEIARRPRILSSSSIFRDSMRGIRGRASDGGSGGEPRQSAQRGGISDRESSDD